MITVTPAPLERNEAGVPFSSAFGAGRDSSPRLTWMRQVVQRARPVPGARRDHRRRQAVRLPVLLEVLQHPEVEPPRPLLGRQLARRDLRPARRGPRVRGHGLPAGPRGGRRRRRRGGWARGRWDWRPPTRSHRRADCPRSGTPAPRDRALRSASARSRPRRRGCGRTACPRRATGSTGGPGRRPRSPRQPRGRARRPRSGCGRPPRPTTSRPASAGRGSRRGCRQPCSQR